ncbi:MAG: DUF308 domain-containing protein [Oscillospiraceae bacterium]|nr:DUF308 domain-containing protein [Oscillospiraceae bacterium]
MDKEKLVAGAKSLRRSIIIADIAICLLGLLMIIFPGQSQNVICIAIGVILCILGILRVVMHFSTDRVVVLGSFALVAGVALVGLGVLVILHPEVLAAELMLVFGIGLIVSGVMKIQYAIDFARLGVRGWWLELLLAAALIAFGVIVLCNPFATADALMIYVGISLVVSSICDLISVLRINSLVKDVKSEVTAYANTVNAPAEEPEA